MVTYCGHYKASDVDGQLVLETDVDVALNPAWIGTRQTRNVDFVVEDGTQYMELKPQGVFQGDLPVRLLSMAGFAGF